MPVDSTKAMPSSTSRSEVRGRPVRPCTAGSRGGISGSTSAHSSSLISRDGGEDADDDMPGTLRRRLDDGKSPRTYFCNVFLVRREGRGHGGRRVSKRRTPGPAGAGRSSVTPSAPDGHRVLLTESGIGASCTSIGVTLTAYGRVDKGYRRSDAGRLSICPMITRLPEGADVQAEMTVAGTAD